MKIFINFFLQQTEANGNGVSWGECIYFIPHGYKTSLFTISSIYMEQECVKHQDKSLYDRPFYFGSPTNFYNSNGLVKLCQRRL